MTKHTPAYYRRRHQVRVGAFCLLVVAVIGIGYFSALGVIFAFDVAHDIH